MAATAQLGLFGKGPAAFDQSFAEVERTSLSRGAWFDYAPGWLRGHEQVLDALVESMSWHQERRKMYDRTVDVPRLYALVPNDGEGHPVLEGMRQALSTRYAEPLTRVSLGYYRDGRDSVAWHGDHVARRLPTAIVATVSVGAPRRFLLRPMGGGQSLALSLGFGDLLVMGGTCQRTWQHSVPKTKRAAARIAIMFRPAWSLEHDDLSENDTRPSQ
jgi:alkylated DNA repair dioxygenase AlkB